MRNSRYGWHGIRAYPLPIPYQLMGGGAMAEVRAWELSQPLKLGAMPKPYQLMGRGAMAEVRAWELSQALKCTNPIS